MTGLTGYKIDYKLLGDLRRGVLNEDEEMTTYKEIEDELRELECEVCDRYESGAEGKEHLQFVEEEVRRIRGLLESFKYEMISIWGD